MGMSPIHNFICHNRYRDSSICRICFKMGKENINAATYAYNDFSALFIIAVVYTAVW